MVGKIEEINLRAVSIFTTAQLTAVPPYYSVDTSVDTVVSTMGSTPVTKVTQLIVNFWDLLGAKKG